MVAGGRGASRRTRGAVGVLINNAGYAQDGAIERVPLEAVRRQFETNVLRARAADAARAAEDARAALGQASSTSARWAASSSFPGGGFYHATKYALEAISDALRFEVARLRRRRDPRRAGPDHDRVRQRRDAPRSTARRPAHRRRATPTPTSTRPSARSRTAPTRARCARFGGGPDRVAKAIETALRPPTRADPRRRDAVGEAGDPVAQADARPPLGRGDARAVPAKPKPRGPRRHPPRPISTTDVAAQDRHARWSARRRRSDERVDAVATRPRASGATAVAPCSSAARSGRSRRRGNGRRRRARRRRRAGCRRSRSCALADVLRTGSSTAARRRPVASPGTPATRLAARTRAISGSSARSSLSEPNAPWPASNQRPTPALRSLHARDRLVVAGQQRQPHAVALAPATRAARDPRQHGVAEVGRAAARVLPRRRRSARRRRARRCARRRRRARAGSRARSRGPSAQPDLSPASARA